ncbi:hypothetical protein HK405_006949 [Cladochytrium tenue]|nr:hypothetical protein HK405_006949 [Cladochytrium tenue]
MKITKVMAGGMLVLALAGGGVAVAASMASANSGTTAPGIGVVGQTAGKPGPGVTVHRGAAAPEIGAVGQTGDKLGPGVTVHHAAAVLVAEDELILARAIGNGLRRAGMTVDVVHDGQAAVDLLRIQAYEAVVLDRDLPVLSGDEVCRPS